MVTLMQRFKDSMSPTRVIIFSFALTILTGTVLLSLPAATQGGRISLVNALFTATSAVCVTGLVVVDTGTFFTTFGQVVILLLIQIGGLGLMTMSTLFFILLGRKIGLRSRLIMQEAFNQYSLAGVIRLTKSVVLMTLFLEGVGAILLSLRFSLDYGLPRGIYFGVFHAVSAFCNAGFDLFGGYRSLTLYVNDITVNLVFAGLIIFGGLGFTVVGDLYQKRDWRRLSLHSKIVLSVTAFLVVFGSLAIYMMEYGNPATLAALPPLGKILASYFQAVTPRTAGFNTLPTGSMTNAGLFFTLLLMFIGASPASTGGGVKTTTFGVLLLAVVSVIHGKEDIEIYQKRVSAVILYRALAITLLSLFLVITVTMALLFTEAGHAGFLPVLFETVSAFGTVGLSMGITTGLTQAGRILIIMTMFAGRVGPLSLFLALAQHQHTAAFHYPEEKIMVG